MATALEGVRGQRHAPAAFYSWERLGTHCIGAGWAPGPVWTGVENLASTRIRTSDRPVRSQSLIPTELPGPLDLQMVDINSVEHALNTVH